AHADDAQSESRFSGADGIPWTPRPIVQTLVRTGRHTTGRGVPDRDAAAHAAEQGASGPRSPAVGAAVRGPTAPHARPPAGSAPNFADTRKIRWFVGSRPMLRAAAAV